MNFILFFLVTIIWGSSWLAIKFQLGVVDPMVSIFWRFFLASMVMFVVGFFKKSSFKLTMHEHLSIASQASLIFCFNFVFLYYASFSLSSGLVAVVFSLFAITNVIFSVMFLGKKPPRSLWVGSVLGVMGIIIIFSPEYQGDWDKSKFIGLAFALIGTICASLGNIIAAKNKIKGIKLLPTMAFGMGYGALIVAVLAIVQNRSFAIDFNMPYILSLLYLSLLATCGAFGMYLTLLHNIGPDKAGYTAVMFPIVALILSFTIEGAPVHIEVIYGTILALFGNYLVLNKKFQ